ncbi:MAG: CreA family protein [archaeon]
MLFLCLVFPGPAFTQQKIGEIPAVKRIIQGDDKIIILAIPDPENPFITCYVTHIISGEFFAAADPSNNSIAVRLTGKIPRDEKRNMLVNKKTNLNIFSLEKSIGSKELRIARHYDAERKTLIYTVYSTKWLGGSLKHSVSAVVLRDDAQE